MRISSLVPLLLCCAILTAAACARDETASVDTTSPTGTATGADAWDPVTTGTEDAVARALDPGSVSVRLLDYRIEMRNTIPAGETTFHITNSGKERHNFEIEGPGIEEELENDLAPGESGTLRVKLEPGIYRIYCPVANHDEEHGMTMQLTVQ